MELTTALRNTTSAGYHNVLCALQLASSVRADEPLFQPFPSQLTFHSYEPGKTYEAKLFLRNNDTVSASTACCCTLPSCRLPGTPCHSTAFLLPWSISASPAAVDSQQLHQQHAQDVIKLSA